MLVTTFAPHENGIGVWVAGKPASIAPFTARLICASVNVLAAITRPPFCTAARFAARPRRCAVLNRQGHLQGIAALSGNRCG